VPGLLSLYYYVGEALAIISSGLEKARFVMAKITPQCIFGLPLSFWWWKWKMHNFSVHDWRELLVFFVACSW